MATKKKTRRGRYRTAAQKARAARIRSTIGVDPSEHVDSVRALAEALEAESRVRGAQSRRLLVEALAAGALVAQRQAALHAVGELSADEGRGIPSLIRGLAKVAELAAVASPVEIGDCMPCLGRGEIDGQPCEVCDATGVEP